jgi:hypothetical protein
VEESSSSAITVGGIAFVQYNSRATDNFAFVVLEAIAAGAEIKFTDNGWEAAPDNEFRATDGILSWIAPAGGGAVGTIVTITAPSTASIGTVSSIDAGFDLATAGDQILAYQGTEANPTFITAINNEGSATSQSTSTSSNTSALPPGLTNGTNAVAVSEKDNVDYNASVTTGTAATLSSAINTSGNWSGNNGNNIITYSGPFTVTGGGACSATTTFDEPDCSCPSNPTATADGPYTICSGSTITFTDAAIGGAATTGTWSIFSGPDMTASQLSNTAATANPETVNFTPLATGTYVLRLTTDAPLSCVAAFADATVVVETQETATLSYSPDAACSTDSDLSATVGGTLGGSFAGSLGLVFADANGTVDVSATQPGTYDITYTSSTNICQATATDQVVVNALPLINAQPASPAAICSQAIPTTASFSVAASNGGPGSSLNYQWQLSTDGGASFSNLTDGSGISGSTTANLTIPVSTASMAGNQYRVVVTDPFSGTNCETASNAASLIIEHVECTTYPWDGN